MVDEKTIRGLEEDAELATIRLRVAKRNLAIEQLKETMKYVDSKNPEEIGYVYKACWDFVAQHRVMFKRLKLK